MTTIWKFSAPITDDFAVVAPDGARFLSVQMQAGKPCIWMLVDPSKPARSYMMRWYGTGHDLDMPVDAMTFLGTVQLHELVFHLFAADPLDGR